MPDSGLAAATRAPAARTLPPAVVRAIVFALAMGGFAIGTSEFVVMGLMPDIARGLAVDEPRVGHVISAYALGVVVGAPLLAILGARLQRRPMLLALMGFYALGNLACALAPNYLTMMAARFVAGLPHGAYFGVASLVAASISPPGQRGAAVSKVLMGLAVALLVGNPFATWLGQTLGWRAAFALVAMIAVATVVSVARSLPPDPDEPRADPIRELRDFNRAPVWLAMGIGAIGFAGMFCVFSYLAPTMIHVTGVPEAWTPLGMLAFGVGGILGNHVGGKLFDRLQFRAVAIILLWSAVLLLVFPLAAHSMWTLLPAVVAVGTMGALAPVLQAHLMDVAGEAQTLAAASNHSAFNTANALGPWLGGMAITAGLGWTSTGYVGVATAVAGLLVFVLAWRQQRHASAGRLSPPATATRTPTP